MDLAKRIEFTKDGASYLLYWKKLPFPLPEAYNFTELWEELPKTILKFNMGGTLVDSPRYV